MRNNPRGGMQTGGTAYSLYCPKCGKPAATLTINGDERAYMHFTRRGVVRHLWDGNTWTRKQKSFNDRRKPTTKEAAQ